MANEQVVLDLYVVGDSSHTATAVANFETIRDRLTDNGRSVEATVHDLGQSPELARTHAIVLTPTLIRRCPAPERRVVGDLSQLQRVAAALQIDLTSAHREEDPSP